MVKTKDEVEMIVRNYAKEVKKDYRITQIILFGSYAWGNAREESDIDVAIVSPDFRRKAEMEILEELSRKTINVNTALEVLAFTPDELENADPRSLLYRIKTKGIPIAA